MMKKIVFAGAGGQGALLAGKLLASAAMHEGLTLTYFPSYGAEVRGGTSNCNVVLTDGEEIFSPTVEEADVLVIFNQPSYDRFAPRLTDDGLLFVESSLVDASGTDADRVVQVSAADTARELGVEKAINVVMLGAVNARAELVRPESLVEALRETMTGKKSRFLDVNIRALQEGYRIVGRTFEPGTTGDCHAAEQMSNK